MLFNSFHFLFFFILVTTSYFLLPHRFRYLLLLAASCYFYMAFVPIYILILGFTIVVDYFAGILIERATGPKRRSWLIMSLVANIGVLCVFKYYNFINDNISWLLKGFALDNPIPYLKILLPIGLSFHTFQAMSYTIEVYRGHQKAERHFGIYALYVMFYPQLVAGPIERPQNLLQQFRVEHTFDADRIYSGLKLMLWGFFKKIVVADRLALYVNTAFNNVNHQDGWTMVLATIFFSFQIYCDFSAYSDIAIGSARVMGFDLMKNFNRPNLSRTTAEYWKRWHISLSTWFKDYLFFPMGGSKVGKLRRYYNLMVVFFISGFWHGASWTYVIWGCINGFYLVFALITQKWRDRFNQFIGITRFKTLFMGWSILTTFLLVTFSRVFFRSNTIQDAFTAIKKMLTFSGSIFGQGTSVLVYSFTALSILIAQEIKAEFFPSKFSFSEHPKFWVRNLYFALLILLILVLGVYDGGQFIYFQF